MVNPFTGPDSTASHFFIAAKKFLLDGKRVTFGKILLKIELITVEDCLRCLQILLPLSELLHASTKRNNALLVLLCFCINRSQYDDDDDYINLCHKVKLKLAQVVCLNNREELKPSLEAARSNCRRLSSNWWPPMTIEVLGFTPPSTNPRHNTSSLTCTIEFAPKILQLDSDEVISGRLSFEVTRCCAYRVEN
ncbi:hypothetical protein NC652_015930 [Populus alba x Populus x berolinensis]|nr:hypothetical protein NC652_015930 [Populus alba x Populus x berolinensis]